MNRKVFVVDDDKQDILLLRSAFEEQSIEYDIKEFYNGTELLDFIESNPEEVPHYIITDLKMPLLDGIQTTQQMRKFNSFQAVPVVMLSTSSLHSDIESAYKGGVNNYINKPTNYTGWLSTSLNINKWVDRWYQTL